MKNVKLHFYKNAIVDDPSHLYNPFTQKITIQNLSNTMVTITFEDEIPSSLTFELVHSNILLVEEYKGELVSNCETFHIDADSKLTRIGLYIDVDASLKLKREVLNEGYYHNIQLDVSDASISMDEKVQLLHPDSSCLMNSAIYAQKKNTKFYTTNFIHQKPSTKSDCKIYGVCNDSAQLSLATDAYIIKGASQSKAKQEGRIIHLTGNCKGVIYPDLHIDENDVEAAHSCSVGSVNLDHLYYLQTRGFSMQEGKNLLIKSYFTPIFQYISDESLKEKMQLAIQKRIG